MKWRWFTKLYAVVLRIRVVSCQFWLRVGCLLSVNLCKVCVVNMGLNLPGMQAEHSFPSNSAQCFSDTKHDSPMIPLKNLANPSLGHRQFPPKFRNSNLHNITHSEISQNPRERMFLVQILLFIVTFFSLISRILSLMQTTKEVNTHPCIAPCTITWSVNFFFLCHLLDVGACICHVVWEGQVEWATPTEVRGEWIQIS